MGKYGRGHIGKTFNDGKLTVVDGGDKVSYVKVKCSVCAEDSELFGDGIFEISFSNLNKGCLPCGCSKVYKWSIQQYTTLVNRKIASENLPIVFNGFIEVDKKLGRCPVSFICSKTGEEYVVLSLNNFFTRGTGTRGIIREKPDKQISKFNASNKDKWVWHTGKVVRSGGAVLGYYCKTCEENGNESLYTIVADSLFNNKQCPCLCCPSPSRVPQGYYMENIKRSIHENSLVEITPLGLIYKNSQNKPHGVFCCSLHGVYSRSYAEINGSGFYCMKCSPPAGGGYKTNRDGYLYLLWIKGTCTIHLGYGITNNLKRRIREHKRNLKSIGATITNIQVFEGAGTAVLAVENAIKALHTTGLLDCEGFRRESISIDMKDKVLEKCSKLKELDNADKLI